MILAYTCLFAAGEILAQRLATVHNLRFIFRLLAAARDAIAQQRFAAWRVEFWAAYRAGRGVEVPA